MMDGFGSDKSDNDDNENDNEEVNLTGFLFGNIDSKGRLDEDNIFDNESKKLLSSLER